MVGTELVEPALDLPDPWATIPEPRSPRRWWRPIAAWCLTFGVLVELYLYSGRRWTTVAAAALVAAAMELVIRARRPLRAPWGLLRPIGLAVLVALAVRPLGGTPATLLALVVVVADAALVSWMPTAAWPRRTRPTVGIAVGLLIVAQVVWIRSQLIVPTAVLVLAALALVEAAGRAPALVEPIERGAEQVAAAIGRAALTLVLAVVCLPVLYLPGAVVRVVTAPSRRRRRRRSASTWVARGTGLADDRRDGPRPFASTAPDVRWRRVVSGLAVVAVVVAIVVVRRGDQPSSPYADAPRELFEPATATSSTSAPSSAPAQPQLFATDLAAPYSELPAFDGVPWADELEQEQSAPEVDGNHEGRYRNIRNGRRVTLRPKACECPEATLWISGGSAVFGEGQRDDHTIASDLVRLAASDGIELHVVNVSHDGYTFQMEVEWEVLQSLRTEDPPDLLVFYNGWNDVVSEVASQFRNGGPVDRSIAVVVPDDLVYVNDRTEQFLRWSGGRAAGLAAAQRYRRVQEEVTDAAKDAGVAVRYFLQSDAVASPNQQQGYEVINGLAPATVASSPLAQALDTMASSLGDGVEDLRHLFDDVDEPTFIGLVHQNEVGARIVARELYRRLRPEIRRLAG